MTGYGSIKDDRLNKYFKISIDGNKLNDFHILIKNEIDYYKVNNTANGNLCTQFIND